MPAVSVVTATFNYAQYIPEAIESVLAQTFTDWEMIVVDDGSTDDTQAVVARYGSRIRYVWQERQERSAARNRGIYLAEGDLITFLDADDVWFPDFLACHVSAMERYPEAVVTHSPVQAVDSLRQPMSYDGSAILGQIPGLIEHKLYAPDDILVRNSLIPCGVVVRKSALTHAGHFDNQVYLGEDWDLWIRLARVGPFVYLPHVLSQYRLYEREKDIRKRASDACLNQYIYVINKATRSAPEANASADHNRALAQVHFSSAIASYQVGDIIRGKHVLDRAMQFDPTLREAPKLMLLLEDRTRRIWRDTGDIQQAWVFLDRIASNLPGNPWLLREDVQRIKSRVCMSETFFAYSCGDLDRVWETLWQAIRLDPTWLRNRGVVSIAARVTWRKLGARVKHVLR